MLLVSLAFAAVPPPVHGGAESDDFPAVVTVEVDERYYTEKKHWEICSGIVVAPNWVLTAASCVDDRLLSFDIGWINVYVGTHSDEGTSYQTTHWIEHPQFVPYEVAYDLALLEMPDPIRGVTPMPIDVGGVSDDDIGRAFELVGFGQRNASDDGDARTRRAAEIALSAYDELTVEIEDAADQVYPCDGDAGGGILRIESDGTYALTATDSSDYDSSGCSPGVATGIRLDAALDFLDAWSGYTAWTPASSGGDDTGASDTGVVDTDGPGDSGGAGGSDDSGASPSTHDSGTADRPEEGSAGGSGGCADGSAGSGATLALVAVRRRRRA